MKKNEYCWSDSTSMISIGFDVIRKKLPEMQLDFLMQLIFLSKQLQSNKTETFNNNL